MVGVPTVAQALAKVPAAKRKQLEEQKSGKRPMEVYSVKDKKKVKGKVSKGRFVVSKNKAGSRWTLFLKGTISAPFARIVTSGSTGKSSSRSRSKSKSKSPRRSSRGSRSRGSRSRSSSRKR